MPYRNALYSTELNPLIHSFIIYDSECLQVKVLFALDETFCLSSTKKVALFNSCEIF